jgi:hypothetical protein
MADVQRLVQTTTDVPTAPQAPQEPHHKTVSQTKDGVTIDNGDGTSTVIDESGVRTTDNATGKVIRSIAKPKPGVVVPPFVAGVRTIPPQAVDISVAFFSMIAFIAVGGPLARAFARRMDRKAIAPAPSADPERLARIEQSLEAVALEVERIGEGQRYVTQLMASRGDAVRVGSGQ